MQDIFNRFAEQLAGSVDTIDLHNALAETASALDLSSFAYLSLPFQVSHATDLISTYSQQWTSHYLHSRYEDVDPVIQRARRRQETFRWDAHGGDLDLSAAQRQFMDEATQYGVRCGFTIPIHDRRGLFAALTFASDERQPLFIRLIERYERALQLIAIFFHIHARRRLISGRIVDGIALSGREIECLQWAAHGKSAWDIGRILGISQRTAAFHLDNAKKKLGVRTITQAAIRFAISKSSDLT
ncbi:MULTISPECIES: LuxR family transcriptional regulator [unclassified Mesorhizobium]|uniref:LuxR family transcriptional regulator n=1 Tax=unclassified Mesorhizobium TaxID=325217 RepID=UPI001092CC2F|nr:MULTISPECIES: LuxR family transcriptional regulator [unclassified Mesorhizobium]TGS43730.1 LuxR family transcriptional regulator [Mesorhizobium sp. M8A.F.Ca.ET.182.01.1.1]TGS78311.1 LuxR family transcriptional regulator [Mesorhizobium sp. M8A.F.Ca.ET.181.01.1.1]TGV15450.1 LuxR family transcriptional regulator [Mesorhizobium sp. M8A.F.Ca.ET.173.01.1.1]